MSPQESATIEAGKLVDRLNTAILFPTISLLSGIAFLVFIYGCALYIMNADNESARAEGKKHITFGIIGLVVMASAFAILSIAAGTFGLNQELDCAQNPSASGCNEVFRLPNPGGTPPVGGPNPGTP